MSAVYVHGAKHLLDASRKAIIEVINSLDHTIIVDPFCGSGTFVAASKAMFAAVNIVGESLPHKAEICNSFPQQSFSVTSMDALDFLEETTRGYDPKELLFLDPPRPESVHYGPEMWTKHQQIHLLQHALEWRGPVVMCGYFDDTPALSGGGWDWDAKGLPRPISELVRGEPVNPDMFWTFRSAL